MINIDSEETEHTPQLFSSTLQQRIVEENNREKIDYLDNLGNITIAADKGYATRIITKTDDSIIESYYDPDGNMVRCKSGYHTVIQEYDQNGQLFRKSYLDIDEKLVMLPQGYAIEETRFDKYGRKEYVIYFDTYKVPVCSKTEGYGKKYEYDSKGHIYKITYLDQFGNALIAGNGYAIVIRSFYETDGYENGKIENEFYYDKDEEPIQLSLGQYGIHRDYYIDGESEKTTYLDIDGKLMTTNRGYASVLRINHEGTYSERYFDLAGNPYKLSEGQYGIQREKGKTVFLNENGSVQFNLRNQLINHPIWVIPIAITIMILAMRLNRWLNIILLIVYGSCILFFTLVFRDNNVDKINIIPLSEFRFFFTDSAIRSGIIKNIWLFIPLGTILYSLFPQSKILLIPLVVSFGIELVQYYTGLGWCDIDDIVSNSLGGAIGYEAGKTIKKAKDVLKNRGQEHKYSL